MKNINELEDTKNNFARIAQEISNYLPHHIEKKRECLNIKFPRKVIRPLASNYNRWPYLSKERKRTVACTIQLCDVNRWHLNVWQIGLTAGTMWEWHCTIPVIAVSETLMYEFGKQFRLINERTNFSETIDTFNSKGIITPDLHNRLHDLRKYRNEIHLYLKDPIEMHDGKPKRYNDAVIALEKLEKALNTYWKKNIHQN